MTPKELKVELSRIMNGPVLEELTRYAQEYIDKIDKRAVVIAPQAWGFAKDTDQVVNRYALKCITCGTKTIIEVPQNNHMAKYYITCPTCGEKHRIKEQDAFYSVLPAFVKQTEHGFVLCDFEAVMHFNTESPTQKWFEGTPVVKVRPTTIYLFDKRTGLAHSRVNGLPHTTSLADIRIFLRRWDKNFWFNGETFKINIVSATDTWEDMIQALSTWCENRSARYKKTEKVH